MPIRATTPDVLTRALAAIDADARAAAGNGQLSQSEQAALAPGVLSDAAAAVRARDGRVSAAALAIEAGAQLNTLLGGVNTRGVTAVSQAEVRALHAVHPDAGVRVARAFELITGKHIDLPGNTPVVTPPVVTPPVVTPPTPAPGGRVAISSLVQTPAPQMPSSGPTTVLPDGSVRFTRGAVVPTTITFDVGGRSYTAAVTSSNAENGTVATTANVVEAIRKAVAPALDLRVTQHDSMGTVIELFSGRAPAHTGAPIYLSAEGTSVRSRGALRFVLNQGSVCQPGETFSVRIDDKVYTSTARRADTSVKTMVREVRDLAVADGRTIDLREYTNYAPWTFIVTG